MHLEGSNCARNTGSYLSLDRVPATPGGSCHHAAEQPLTAVKKSSLIDVAPTDFAMEFWVLGF